jgi:hypothetical protein
MLSTVGNTGVSVVEVIPKSGKQVVMKPNVQVQYNKHMGGSMILITAVQHTHLTGRQ